MHNASFGDHMASWNRLGKAVANNASELSHLQRDREALARARRAAQQARRRQAAARAAAQQATRDLEAAMASAHEAATRLRSGLWGYYGRKSNKLIEFGMRPYAPARQREIAPPRWGALPQREPVPPSPRATPERDGETLPKTRTRPVPVGETFPNDARTRDAGTQRPFALGNGSPTSPSDARAGWQPAGGDSPWPGAERPFPHGVNGRGHRAGTTPTGTMT